MGRLNASSPTPGSGALRRERVAGSGRGSAAARLASFAAAARDTTSASPRSAAELLPVYSSAIESLARGTMKTSPYVNPHKLFMLLDNSAPAVWFTILCSFSSFTY